MKFNEEKTRISRKEKQAGAELCQAQVKLEVMVGDLVEVGVEVAV